MKTTSFLTKDHKKKSTWTGS